MLKVCLTHDIDRIEKTYQYITKPLRDLLKGNFKLCTQKLFSCQNKNPYWGFNHIIDIETRFDVKSTCFFLDESYPFLLFKPSTWKLSLGRYKISDKKIVDVMQYLDRNGWEIALHGSYRSFNTLSLLKKGKNNIEKILGHSIIGIRQHYLNWNELTWQIQEEAGFLYDSTWGMTSDIGFKQDKIIPFFPITDSSFCEIPLNIMDFPFMDIENKWNLFEAIVNKIEQENGYLVINFHSNNFDELDFPNVKNTYIELIQRLKERNAIFLTMQEAYHQIICP